MFPPGTVRAKTAFAGMSLEATSRAALQLSTAFGSAAGACSVAGAYAAGAAAGAVSSAAKQKAADCLGRYGEQVSSEAEALMQENDYPGAIERLKSGNDILSNRYGSFSDAIDTLLPEC